MGKINFKLSRSEHLVFIKTWFNRPLIAYKFGQRLQNLPAKPELDLILRILPNSCPIIFSLTHYNK